MRRATLVSEAADEGEATRQAGNTNLITSTRAGRTAATTLRNMGRIKGHYEWDDDDLTPGHKKEGGLHQNLFDGDGNLKGSARFIPDDETESDELVITETVYVPIEQRRKSREQEELEAAIAAIVSHLIDRGIARAKPILAQWYRETARPAFDAQRAKIVARRARGQARKTGVIEVANVEPGQEVIEAPAEDRPDMSRAEAQARYLAALAARAYSDEQMRLVASANIGDREGDGITELERSLAELPPAQVRSLLEAMATDPTMLREDTLAELASILGRRDPSPENVRRLH
jgi:hypothetical protein